MKIHEEPILKFFYILLLFLAISENPLFCLDNEGAMLHSEFQVNTYTTNHQKTPSIASDGKNYLVIWNSYGQDGSVSGVFGQLLDNVNRQIGPEFQINSYTESSQSLPSVTSNGTTYLVSWQSGVFWSEYSQDGSGEGIYAQLLDNDAHLIGSEFRVNTYTSGSQSEPTLISNGNNYLVTWQSANQDGSGYGVYGQFFDNDGNILGSEFRVNTYTSNSQNSPSIASDGRNYLVTWESDGQDGSLYGIYGQFFDNDGNILGSEFRVNTYTSDSQDSPSIASDGRNYLVTWESYVQDGSGYGIFAQLLDNDANLIGSEFRVNTCTNGSQCRPSASSDGVSYLITWQSYVQDGDEWGVFGQLFDNEGNPIGTEFQVNTYTTKTQSLSSVGSEGETYLITWQSGTQWPEVSQDGSGEGVYAQKFIYSDSIIYKHPSSNSVFMGSDAVFTVTAIDDGELHYQWYKHDTVVGTDSDTLTLTSVQLSDNDSIIYCVVTDIDNDTVCTEEALLTVLAPIEIIQQPQSQISYQSKSKTFTVLAYTEAAELHYQWYKNNVAVGENTNEYFIEDPQLCDNDSTVRCVISNYCTTITSESVTLTVIDPYSYGTEFQVDTYNTTFFHPGPKTASNGTNFLVVWTNLYAVYGQLYDNESNPIGSKFQISTDTYYDKLQPYVTSDGTNYFVSWPSLGQDGDETGVYGQIINSEGNKIGTEFRINTVIENVQQGLSVASNGSTYLATWISQLYGEDEVSVSGQLFDNEGNKIGSEFQIGSSGSNYQSMPSVSSDGENYLVTWRIKYSGVYGQLYDNEGDLIGTEFLVNDLTGNYSSLPAVTSDATNYLVTWTDSKFQLPFISEGEVYAQLFDNDANTIGTEFLVNTYTENNQSSSEICSDGKHYFVVWQSEEQDGSGHGIYGQLFDNEGNKIGTEIQINTYTTNNQSSPSVTSDGKNYLVTWESYGQNGNIIVVNAKLISFPIPIIYEQPLSQSTYVDESVTFSVLADTPLSDLHYRWYKNGISVGTDTHQYIMENPQFSDNESTIYCEISNDYSTIETDVATLTVLQKIIHGREFNANTFVSSQYNPSVVSDGTNFLIAWDSRNQDGDNDGVFAQFFDNEGNPIGSEFQINTYTTSEQERSSIASDGRNYFVAWQSKGQDGDEWGVFGQLLDNEGNLIGAEFQINAYTAYWQKLPSVASNGSNYLVTWQSSTSQDGSDWGVYGQLFDNDANPIESEFLVNTYTTSFQSNSCVVSDGKNYLVTWNSNGQDGNGTGIYGQLFDNEANPIGTEFQINTYTTDFQNYPSVTSDGKNYLVTWISYNQDGDNRGIYGQLIDNEGDFIRSEFQINSYIDGWQSDPSVTSDGTHYLVTWCSSEQDGSYGGIFGQLYDNDANPIGSEFQVNNRSLNYQNHPAVASDGKNWLVTWYSFEPAQAHTTVIGGGSNNILEGIFAKLLIDLVPEITKQPYSRSVFMGNNVTFSINAVGFGELHYQWYKNDEIIGTDSDILTLKNVPMSDNDSIITCVVSDDDGNYSISESAQLLVWAPIVIIEQPKPQGCTVNESVTYSISAETQIGDLHYQWIKLKLPFAFSIGSDNDTVTLENCTPLDEEYLIYCEVSNYCTTVISEFATLTVNGYGDEFQVNTYYLDGQFYPEVASSGLTFLVAWDSQDQDGDGLGVYAQLFDNDGNMIGSEFQVDPYSIGEQRFSSISSNGTNYFVAWNSQGDVYGKLYDNQGTVIRSKFKINTYINNGQGNLSVTSDGINYFVAWMSVRIDGGIYGQLFDNDGNMIGSELQISSTTAFKQSNPSVASNGNNYLVAWESEEIFGEDYIYGQLFDNEGNMIGSEFQINYSSETIYERPSVTSDGTNYLVTWSDLYLFKGEIYGKLFDGTGNTIGSKFQINTYSENSQIYPSVSSKGDNYLVTWQSYKQNNNHSEIYAQLLDNEGNKIESEFLVNSYITYGQENSSVCSDGSNYFVAWSSDGNDGDGWGIFAKLLTSQLTEIYDQPSAQTICVGDNVNFTIGAVSSKNLHYQWYKNSVMVGSDLPSLSFANVQLSDNDSTIYCVVTDEENASVYSDQVKLNVAPTIDIQQNPQSTTVHDGGIAIFNVTANSEGADLHYQWYRNDIPIGADDSELVISGVSLTDNDSEIFCRVYNYGCYEISYVAILQVLDPSFRVIIHGIGNIDENEVTLYTAYACYGYGPFDVFNITNDAQWLVLEPDNCADFISSGILKTYPIDEKQYITIRTAFSDEGETHWKDLSVTVDTLFKVSGMNPMFDGIITQSPDQIILVFNKDVDPNSVNGNTCRLTKAGDDKEFDTADDSQITVYTYLPNSNQVSLVLENTILPNDIYEIKLSGIYNIDGDLLDGEFDGEFPSGDSISGGDFMATAPLSRLVDSVTLNDNDTVTIQWLPFKDATVYIVEYRDSFTFSGWFPVEPVEQWPIEETTWTGDSWQQQPEKFYRVVGIPPSPSYITIVSPPTAYRYTTYETVYIEGSGTNWTQDDISVSFGEGVIVYSIEVTSPTQIQLIRDINSETELGFRDLIITCGSKFNIKENALEIIE